MTVLTGKDLIQSLSRLTLNVPRGYGSLKRRQLDPAPIKFTKRRKLDRASIEDEEEASLLKNKRKAESFHSLPDDIISIILLELPVKSILRFRSVCNSWNQIILDPYFVKTHLTKRKGLPRVFALQTRKPPQPCNMFDLYSLEEETFAPELKLGGEFPAGNKMVMSLYHCDGLILFYSSTNIYLCNPSTRESLALPKFSPGKCINNHTIQYIGFGLNLLTNKYKVVRMFYRNYCTETLQYSVGCEVFTPGSDSWKQVGDCPHTPFQHYSVMTSQKGMLYWTTLHFKMDPAIISFDLSSDEFGVVRPPQDVLVEFEEKRTVRYLMNGHEDRLWLVHLHWDPVIALHIWELADETKHSWTKVHVLAWRFWDQTCIPLPVLAVPGRRKLVLASNRNSVTEIYDIESGERRVILPAKGQVGRENLVFHVCLCIESLVTLK